MTAVASPVEIGSGRRSVYIDSSNAPDVTDPNWIPVLPTGALPKNEEPIFNEKEVSPYNTASFTPFPQVSTPKPGSRAQSLKHSHSKSSVAPEAVLQELEAAPLPLPIRTSSKSPRILASPTWDHLRGSSDGQETATSEGDGSTAPSTTASMIEDQYYTLPNMEVQKEDIQPPTAPMSARSSIMSAKAKGSFVPTSKYNRKGALSVASLNRPPTIRSEPASPHESPRASTFMPVSELSLPLSEPSPPTPPPPTQSPTLPLVSSTPSANAKLHASKSSASDRKFRALGSHPSAQNIQQAASAQPLPNARTPTRSRSRANSNSGDVDLDILPKPPSVKYKPRKSTDSRPGTPRSIFDSQTPTPAPTTPLPQLPPEAFTANKVSSRKTSIRTINRAAETHIASASVITLPKAPDHAEMADFMSRKSTVVFRRFDDVHVKLLLCLQDEISALEEQLFALEQDAHENSIDRPGQTMRVMRELRRVVAEYDHLFTNWSQMQANKADPQTIKDLREWLENPKASAGGQIASGAKEDLNWLKAQKDLTSVRLGETEKSPVTRPVKEEPVRSEGVAMRKAAGFAALFNCAGKRR